MKKELTAEEVLFYNKIYLLLRELERDFENVRERSRLFGLIRRKLLNPPQPLSDLGEKLLRLKENLGEDMTRFQLMVQIVPIERALHRAVADPDFIIFDKDRDFASHVLRDGGQASPLPLSVILDNLRSAFNVGSILRTAECLKMSQIYFGGYTPTPQEGKGFPAAMGSEGHVQWESYNQSSEIVDRLQQQGIRVVGFETVAGAVSVFEPFLATPTVFLIGNERFGLEEPLLKRCDEIRSLPVYGVKNSLNVAVCFAVAAYEWSRQYRK